MLATGCGQPPEVRVYDGPKSDTVFVSGPNASSGTPTAFGGSSSSSSPSPMGVVRRILGAVIPTESGCYFLKATDTPERLQPLISDFYTIVTEFAIDPSTGRPNMTLPTGWVMNPRNDIAMAEFVSPAASGSAKFTVTMLAMPPAAEWESYLLSNINRWRGQLKLPEITVEEIERELIPVKRPSNLLPGYIFDADGTGSGGMSSSPVPPKASVPGSKPSAASGPEQQESKKPALTYELPEGWRSVAGTPFRLATFSVSTPDGDGEVTVSMAVDNPLGNTMMWYQQVSRESDPEKIKAMAESTVSKSEKIASAMGEGLLYTIRGSEQEDSPTLLVASLPSDREGLHAFVKLRGDTRVVEAQRDNLLKFVQSLQLQ